MNNILLAFNEAMTFVANELKLAPTELNLWFKFNCDGITHVFARKEEKKLATINVEKLVIRKMIASKLCADKLTHFFRTIHLAHVRELRIEKPEMVSLVLYLSKAINQICIGISINGRAIKAIRLSEVVKLTGLGSSALN